MRRTILYISLLLITACGGGNLSRGGSDNQALIEAASTYVSSQRFDEAMEKALQALDMADDDPLLRVRALACITGIDIMTSRDADAWDKADEAESIARAEGFREELSGILISKAKLCSYAEISPETGRNDEGLAYATEALSLAREVDAVEQECEACYVIASLYINKNRWNDPIDPGLYRLAGEYLDKGQALADTYDIPRLKRNGILFRSRWFQQGNRNDEAIKYFEQVLATLREGDYLTASALEDRLVRLYTRTGQYQKALDTHDSYVLHTQKYIQQKQDETLQEMETRFEVQAKQRALERSRYRISLLVLALLLAIAVIVLIGLYLRKLRRRSAELQRISDSREQIIEFLSKDLKNPANAIAGDIAALSAQAATLSPGEIRTKCQELAKNTEEMNADVARYVGDILVERSKKIADIGLSPREIQIIRLSAEGLTAAQIAERTCLSVHTINTHRRRIYGKMDVRNVADLIHKATEMGIL
ncbi:MAG: LuxR C-terminal-related transcriptional regulator [Bacteroidales bacterium]|nr:LuxR C-terminal-related transcriptional regulator [Bacteroidales bacterium]